MTDLYAVIGKPIAHSKSPEIHLAFAEQTGQDLAYVRIEGEEGGFAAQLDAFRAQGGLGLNITVPFKLDAFAYADVVEDGARLAGAVNCLSFDGPRAAGANFDGVGALRDIEVNLGVRLAGKRVLLLGAGGAARGVLVPLAAAGVAELVVANRTVPKAEAVAALAGSGRAAGSGYAVLSGAFDVVVNATSASLFGESLPLPPGVFGPDCLAYDMTYGRGLTPFLRQAKEAGVRRLADGAGMLVEQAAEAFLVWRGVRPATEAVIRAIAVPLA